MAELQDPELKGLADALAESVLGSRADSTVRKYLNSFQRCRRWAKEVTVLPAGEVHFALYLQYLSDQKLRLKVDIWFPSPIAECRFVRATLSGLQRKLE